MRAKRLDTPCDSSTATSRRRGANGGAGCHPIRARTAGRPHRRADRGTPAARGRGRRDGAHPHAWRLAGLLAESAVEGARAHLRVPGQPLHRELLVEVPQRPLPRRGSGEVIRRRHLPVDELRLAALPPRRHHTVPGDGVGHLRAVIGANDVQAQVDSGGKARRGEHVAVIDEQHVLVEQHLAGAGAACRRRTSNAWSPGRPSSSPAAASTNAPVQIDTSRVPGRIRANAADCLWRQHAVDAGGRIARAGDHDGVGGGERLRAPRRAARRSPSSPRPVRTSARTSPPRRARRPSASVALENSVGAIAASNPTTGGSSRTATRCMPPFWHVFDEWCHSCHWSRPWPGRRQ